MAFGKKKSIFCVKLLFFRCTGVFTHMLTDGTNFGKEFPGLKPYLLTLNGQFYFPFRRDFGINLGNSFYLLSTLL
jgi:hypothetical protein